MKNKATLFKKEKLKMKEEHPTNNWDELTCFECSSCMFFSPKNNSKQGRCKANFPTMKGFPVVFGIDWCGYHKIGINPDKKRFNNEKQNANT